MGRVYNKLSKVSTDRASASLALARFLASAEFRDLLPYLDWNRAFLSREEWDERHKYSLEEAEESRQDYETEEEWGRDCGYWLTKYEDDTEALVKAVETMKKSRAIQDLELFAEEWEIPFDASFALQTALMTKGAHDAWNSSWCY